MRIHNQWSQVRTRSAFLCTVCLIFCICMGSGHAQSTASYGLRYTVDVWTGANQDSIAVLMPRSARLSGKDKQTVLKNLFSQMKRTAAAKYGAASIAFKDGSTATTPEVFIWLDETKSDRHDEVIAEVVYTFSEQGIDKVSFPKFKMQPVARDDIRYASFNLNLPVWQAIGLKSEYVWTQLPSGERISTLNFSQRLAKLDPQVIKAAWSQLELSDEAALKVLKVAIESGFPNRQKRCMSAMESAEAKLRVLGAQCLANVDAGAVKSVVGPLTETLLEDPEDSVRDQVQGILRSSPHATLQQIALMRDLTSSDEAVVLKSIERVQSIKTSAVSQALKTLLAHQAAPIRKSTRACLLKRKEPKVIADILKNEKVSQEIRQETAIDLMQNLTVKATAMAYLAANGTAAHWSIVEQGLDTISEAEQINTLSKALSNQEQSVIKSGLNRFATLKGKVALEALIKFKPAIPDLENLQVSAIGAICSKLSDKVLITTTQSKDVRLKTCAIKTLAAKGASGKSSLKRRLLPVLKKLAKNKDSALRALAIEGLGDLNDKSTHSMLIKATKDSDTAVIAAATGGLRHVDNAESILLELSTHPSPKVIAQAFRAMGVQGFISAINLILKSTTNAELDVRLAGTEALGRLSPKIDNQKAAFNFYSVRINDSDAKVRTMALIGLSQNNDPRRVQAMASLAQDSDLEVQIAAIRLLGQSGDPQAVEGASSGLAHSSVKVRSAAINALKKLGGPEALANLKRHAQQETDAALLKMIK